MFIPFPGWCGCRPGFQCFQEDVIRPTSLIKLGCCRGVPIRVNTDIFPEVTVIKINSPAVSVRFRWFSEGGWQLKPERKSERLDWKTGVPVADGYEFLSEGANNCFAGELKVAFNTGC